MKLKLNKLLNNCSLGVQIYKGYAKQGCKAVFLYTKSINYKVYIRIEYEEYIHIEYEVYIQFFLSCFFNC